MTTSPYEVSGFSVKTKTVALSTGPVTYQEAGGGTPIVHLHGAGSVRHSWGLQLLAQSFRVIMPICPGFDDTPMHDGVNDMSDLGKMTGEFIDSVVGAPADIIGISFGGWHAVWVAINCPDKVGQLVLENPAGFRPSHLPPLTTDPKLRFREMYVYPERLPKDHRTEEDRDRNRAVMADYHPGMTFDEEAHERCSEIKALTLICHGTKDGRIAPETVQMLKARIPHSHLVYLYNGGHSLESDQGERFARLVKDFCLRGESFIVNQKVDDAPKAAE